MPWSRILNVANMSFNAIRENKILTKISEFTVHVHYGNSTDLDVTLPMRSTLFYHIFETFVLNGAVHKNVVLITYVSNKCPCRRIQPG